MARIILKISGEILKGENELVDKNKLNDILNIVNILKDKNEVGIVIGGGNIFRGREHSDFNKVTGDTIGMVGTVINALYIKDYLEKNNHNVIIDTPFDFPDLIYKYQDNELKELFDKKNIIVFGGGIGKSGYSTDSGTILAIKKIKGDMIVKLTTVDGVYDSDPKINKNAIKYDYLSYDEVINKDLKVMDIEAIKYAKDNNIKIKIMNFNDYDKILDEIGTIVGE